MVEYVSHGLRLQDELSDQMEKKLFCDVKIKTGQKEVMAHKNVLAAASKYCHHLFVEDPELNEINILETKYKVDIVLSTFVEYLYGRNIKLTMENVKPLFCLSKQFLLDKLHDACLSFMLKQLSIENCINMFIFFDECNCIEARDICKNIFSTLFHNYYITSEEIMELQHKHITKMLLNGLGKNCTKENLKQFCKKYEQKELHHLGLQINVDLMPTRPDTKISVTKEPRECILMILGRETLLYDIKKAIFLSVGGSDRLSKKISTFDIGPDRNMALLEERSHHYYSSHKTKLKLINIFTEEIISIPDIPRQEMEASAIEVERQKYHFISHHGELYCIYGSRIELDQNMKLICTKDGEYFTNASKHLFRKLETRTVLKCCCIYIVKYDFKNSVWNLIHSVSEEKSTNLSVYVTQKDYEQVFIFARIGNLMSSFLFHIETGILSELQLNQSLEISDHYYRYYDEDYVILCTSDSEKVIVKENQKSFVYSITEQQWRLETADIDLAPGLTKPSYSSTTGLVFGFKHFENTKIVNFYSRDVITEIEKERHPPPFLKDGLPGECKTLYVPCEVLDHLQPVQLLCSPNTPIFDSYYMYRVSDVVSKWRLNRKQCQEEEEIFNYFINLFE